MGVYDSAIATGLRLIAAKGATVTVERYVDTDYGNDPLSVANATDSPGTVEAAFVKFPLNKPTLPSASGDPAKSGDQQGLLPGLDATGTPLLLLEGDILRYGADTPAAERWRIESCDQLAPSGQTVLWKVRVRQWPSVTR